MTVKAKNIHDKPTRKVGFLLKPHGYKGDIKIAIEDPDFIPRDFLLLSVNDKFVPYRIEKYNPSADIIKLTDINSIEAVNALPGREILDFISVSETPEIDYTQYTLRDNATGTEYAITGITEMPQQLLLEFRNGFKDSLFPLHEDLLVNIDHKKKLIVVDFPEGLLDL